MMYDQYLSKKQCQEMSFQDKIFLGYRYQTPSVLRETHFGKHLYQETDYLGKGGDANGYFGNGCVGNGYFGNGWKVPKPKQL